jgi:hypothetical protein
MKIEVWFENGDCIYLDLLKESIDRGNPKRCSLVPSDCIELDESDADCIHGDM